MPKKNHYSILGVPADANLQTIKNAYRRLALKVHPDAGNQPDPARFREVHEAYLVLGDAARRRSYDGEIGLAPRTLTPGEEMSAGRPVSVPGNFRFVALSIGEMLDHIAHNFFR